MKQTISLRMSVPGPMYNIEFVNVYQTADKLIAVSRLNSTGGSGIASYVDKEAQVVVDVPDRWIRNKTVEHIFLGEDYVESSTEFRQIKSQDEIRDLISRSRCVFGVPPEGITFQAAEAKTTQKSSSCFFCCSSSVKADTSASQVQEVKAEFKR